MTRRKPIRRRLRTLFWKVPVRQEVDEEIAFHLEMQTRRYIAEGMEPAAAREAALQRFGNPESVRAECRALGSRMEVEMRRAELRHELRQDLGFALRLLRNHPVFTAVALLTLAVSLGANAAIFSVVEAVLLQALPYRHAERTVVIWNGYDQPGLEHVAIAPAEFADIREQQRTFHGVSAISRQRMNLVGEGEPEQLTGYAVSPNLFSLLGAAPEIGRGFSVEDGQERSEKVVLLSHALWMRRFGGDPSVVGRTIQLGGRPRTVIGVLPAGVAFPDAPVGFLKGRGDVWVPYGWEQARAEPRGDQYLGVVARLRPGVGIEQARADLDTISARFRLLSGPLRRLHALGPGRRAAARRDGRQRAPALVLLLGARSAWCWSSPASTWRTCCSPAAPCERGSWPSAARSARDAAGWCASS